MKTYANSCDGYGDGLGGFGNGDGDGFGDGVGGYGYGFSPCWLITEGNLCNAMVEAVL